VVCFLLTAITAAVYAQVYKHKFIHLDDPVYVTQNKNVQQGLTRENVVWAFTTGHASNYHPLTWLSLMLDYHLFGLNSGAFHLTNLLLHLANTILLFLLLCSITASLWRSAMVAFLFAMHPMHVESVAWVAERKDVLSTFFWMLTILAYTKFVGKKSILWYLLTLFAIILGLLAKPMLVTLPCVLLLLDYWPLRRLFNAVATPTGKNKKSSGWQKLIPLPVLLEKVPLFAIAAASCVITFIVQQKGGAVRSLDIVPIACRITNALVSYMLYIIKMIWPAKLAIFYPHFGKLLITPAIAAAAAGILISLAVFYLRRFRYLTVGWLWYLGTLIPVIGLVQVGRQSMADRYSYIPFIGLFIMVVWGIADLLARTRYRAIILTAASCLLVTAMSICTWIQVSYWRDSIKLFSHAIEVSTANPVAHECLAQNLSDVGRDDEAIEHYRKALQLNENEHEVHNNLGNLLRKADEKALAVEHYKKAIALTENMDIEHNGKPGFFEAHCNMALVLQELGDDKQAVEHFAKALEIRQADAHAYYQYAKSLIELGKYDQAIELCEKAIQSDPKCSRAYYHMGIANFRLGNIDKAIELFSKILQLHPKDAQMHYNIGVLFEKQGDINQAINHYQLSLRYDPDSADSAKPKERLKALLPKQNKTPAN